MTMLEPRSMVVIVVNFNTPDQTLVGFRAARGPTVALVLALVLYMIDGLFNPMESLVFMMFAVSVASAGRSAISRILIPRSSSG